MSALRALLRAKPRSRHPTRARVPKLRSNSNHTFAGWGPTTISRDIGMRCLEPYTRTPLILEQHAVAWHEKHIELFKQGLNLDKNGEHIKCILCSTEDWAVHCEDRERARSHSHV